MHWTPESSVSDFLRSLRKAICDKIGAGPEPLTQMTLVSIKLVKVIFIDDETDFNFSRETQLINDGNRTLSEAF